MAAYLTTFEADQLAEAMLPAKVANYLAASDQDKERALLAASEQIDAAMRYQGRRYAADQEREFPRMAWARATMNDGTSALAAALGDVIWDWDEAGGGSAVVPGAVLRATLLQAEWLLGGGGDRLDWQHEGVSYDQTGGLAESYGQGRDGQESGLCREAFMLMRRYRLRSGAIL
jgi:hypothetical protein